MSRPVFSPVRVSAGVVWCIRGHFPCSSQENLSFCQGVTLTQCKNKYEFESLCRLLRMFLRSVRSYKQFLPQSRGLRRWWAPTHLIAAMALVINIFLLPPILLIEFMSKPYVFRDGTLVPFFVYTIFFFYRWTILCVLYSTLLHLPPHNSSFSLEPGLRPKICSHYTIGLYIYGLRYCFCALGGKLVYILVAVTENWTCRKYNNK